VTSGGVQDNVVGGTNFQTISGGLCDVASNGRATVSETVGSSSLPYVYYMVSNSGGSIQRAYVLETLDSSAAVGFADIQNAPGLSGTYAFVGADLASPGTVAGMLLHSTPNGSGGGALFGIADVGNAGMLESVAVTGSYATASSQRTSVTLTPVAGAQSYVFYLVTGSEFLGLGVTPALDGTGSLQ
jgi:hypothetical protein